MAGDRAMRTGGMAAVVVALAGAPAWAQDGVTDPGAVANETQTAGDDLTLAPRPASLFADWSGDVELGLNGSTGNTESVNFRAAASAGRETENWLNAARALYLYEQSEGDVTENRAEAAVRNDYKFTDSRWRAWSELKYEWDETQDWDHRLSFGLGPGYLFIDRENMNLLGRAGYGGSYEIGGEDEGYTHEGIIGVDFTWEIDERSDFLFTAEYRPSLEDKNDYRLLFRTEYSILLAEKSQLYFKIGAEDKYDSTPGPGVKRNDLDYYAALGWKF